MSCKLIAEIGWNHGGNMDLARAMIEAAAENGADYAKFQTWSVKNLKPGPWDEDGRREIYQQAELTPENHIYLKKVCDENNIRFLTSCFNVADVDFISTLTSRVKVPSPELTNWEMLKRINRKFDMVFLSTGACDEEEIGEALAVLDDVHVTLLHCVSSYPCPYENANLCRLLTLTRWSKDIGYSGHVQGIFDAMTSLEYGVKVIEKHFTIDNNLPGRDNKFAILPDELNTLRQYINCREKMIKHQGGWQDCEQEARDVYRGRWSNNLCNPNS
jgi:N,N'-diacetyllegionaminate synthase